MCLQAVFDTLFRFSTYGNSQYVMFIAGISENRIEIKYKTRNRVSISITNHALHMLGIKTILKLRFAISEFNYCSDLSEYQNSNAQF